MPRDRSPAQNELAELETWLASGLVPVEADDVFVETVHRRLSIDEPRPMEIVWRPPAPRQHILFALAAVGGSLLTLGLAVLLWLYRRSVARTQA